MHNRLITDQSPNIPPVDLLGGGQVVAIVVGVENYQPRREGQILAKVDFARNDAEAFAEVLKSIYPAERLSLTLLRDSEATCASLKNDLGFAIKSLAPDDLFIFTTPAMDSTAQAATESRHGTVIPLILRARRCFFAKFSGIRLLRVHVSERSSSSMRARVASQHSAATWLHR